MGEFWNSALGKSLGGSPVGAFAHVGVNLLVASSIYSEARGKGQGVATSAISAGIQTYWWSKLGIPAQIAFAAKDFLGTYVPQKAMETIGQMNTAIRPFGQQNYRYQDLQNRATNRARAVNLIQQSKQGLRSILGNEAAVFAQRYG